MKKNYEILKGMKKPELDGLKVLKKADAKIEKKIPQRVRVKHLSINIKI